MTATRQYTGKIYKTDRFTQEISVSGISVTLVGMTSDEDAGTCNVFFDTEPTSGDDVILSDIASSHNSQPLPQGCRTSIMSNIFRSAEPTVQAPRLLDAIDAMPSFVAMLDQCNWELARLRAALALSNEIITQDDYDLVNSNLPDYVP